MKNKTLANWLIGSLSLCFLPLLLSSSADQDVFYMLGGTGILVFLTWAIVRMFQTKADWLPVSLLVVFIMFLLTIFAEIEGDLSSLIAFTVVGLGITSVVRLYKTPDSNI